MNKLDMKLYNVLPIAYDDSLSYPEAVQSVVDYINKLIEDGSKKYDDVIKQIESEIQILKSTTDDELEDQEIKRMGDVQTVNINIRKEAAERKTADDRFIQMIEEALKNVKSYYSCGFILIGSSLTKEGKPWSEYVAEGLSGRYQVAESHFYTCSITDSVNGLQPMFNKALAKITVPERVTDVVFLGGGDTGYDETDMRHYMLELASYIHRRVPNAVLRYGYFGETVYPNETADLYEKIIEPAEDGTFSMPTFYMPDSRYLTGNIDFWTDTRNYLTASGCDAINPYIFQLVLNGHVSYDFTRSYTADLPKDFIPNGSNKFTALSNSLTIDESYTEKGYSFTLSSSASFTDGNEETQGPVIMYPTGASADDMILMDTADRNADPNFYLPVTYASFGYDGYYPKYTEGKIYVDTDGVLKVKLTRTDNFVKNGIGMFVV